MKLLLAAALVAACGPGIRPPDELPPTKDFAADFVRASQTGDVATIRKMLGPSVVVGGMWFPDATCTVEFAAGGEVGGGRLDELARCLSTLKLQLSVHEEQLIDVVAMTYEPGFEIEARFLDVEDGPWLSWIGYEARRDASDALPTVSPETLEALRVAGSAAPQVTGLDDDIAKFEFHHAYTWMKVCIDAEGNVTGAHVRETTSPRAARAFTAAIQDWRFRPFAPHGQPLPVCALEMFAAPAGVDHTTIAMPEPIRGPADAVIVPSQALHRTAGQKMIVPQRRSKLAMAKARIQRLIGSFQLCLGRTGNVDSVALLRSTGLPDYDAELMHAIREWTYDPFLDDGKPIPVCSAVTFIYTQR